MTSRTTRVVLLAVVFALATSMVGFAQQPCGVVNEIVCQSWDGGDTLVASQNDTNNGGFGNFATTYQQFTLTQTYDVESFHWVGGYFNPAVQGPITAWTLTLYDDNAGAPGNPLAFGTFPGNGGETFIGLSPGGFPMYVYWLFFNSFDMNAGTYWASVVPDLGFPPQWGWASSAGADPGYQCFFGACAPLGFGLAYAIDGTVVQTGVPEPGSMILLGTGILGLAGALRRKLL